ncbi:leucine-rich repeat and death domain-containing protein 1 isoform X3 [Mauremys mutica]|uniref:leucine-rich repeat and death domain-containing protein 1 isoform X3 n=1 Tax=Mauremys mutica TaxID=74926 RepID=UPI001D16934B|nr:leucine-rich repeat and death domain-containing protein 1 isoform X3 [Mauremys mutica]
MSENLSTSRKEKNEDEVAASLNTEGLNKSPQEVSESDARKDSLQSVENLDMAGKSSARSLEKKDELIVGLNTEGLNEIPHEVTEADASKDILQSFESFQIIEGLSTSMSNEKEDDENIADFSDDGMMELSQEVFETDTKRDKVQSAENFEIAEVFSTSILPEKKSDEFLADLNAEGMMEISQKISERDVEKDTLHSLENLEVFQKLSTSVLQETGDAEELNQIPQEVVEGDAKRDQLQSEENPEVAEKLTKLPEELSKLTCLRELDISHNALKDIPEGIGELKHLVSLTANNNSISQLPKSVTSLSDLQQLNLSGNQLICLPSGLQHLQSLKDINFDGNPLIRPPQEVCKGKQLYTIVCYLESADERDGKILQKIFKIISGNVSFENFEFFCQKLQFNNAEIKSLENNRTLVLEEKILQALEIWKSENKALTPAEMIDQLIRVLTMTGMHYLTNKVKALKLYTQSVKF